MAPAHAQSGRQPAQGTLTVQAVVQGSVALVNLDGEWKVIVANAPDPVETHGSFQSALQRRTVRASQESSLSTGVVFAMLDDCRKTRQRHGERSAANVASGLGSF